MVEARSWELAAQKRIWTDHPAPWWRKDYLCSLSHMEEEFPGGQGREKSNIYLSQRPPPASGQERDSKRGKTPKGLIVVGFLSTIF